MRDQLHIFLNAVMFFTRIPVPSWTRYSESLLNRATRFFPLIGWLAGAVAALVFIVANRAFSHDVAVLLSMAATILLTGAFHEDGLADACDGFGGGWDRERILEIMKDSRIGTYGMVGLGLVLAIKWRATSDLEAGMLPLALIAAHALSRWGATILIRFGVYARADLASKAKPLATRMGWGEFVFATFFGCFPLAFLGDWRVWLTVPLVMATAVWAMRYFRKWIGGYTGDCLGAVQQVCEVLIYLTFVGLL